MTKEQLRAYNKKYRATYNQVKKDEIKDYNAQLYLKNKEEHLKGCHDYHEKNKEVIHKAHQEHYQKYPEGYKASNKFRYATKRDDIKEYLRSNKESIDARQKTYNTEHKISIKKWSKEYGRQPEVIFRVYQRSAKRRDLTFNLTYEQFLTFWQKPCFYSGHGIETIGLDRINNDAGYEMTNVVPCCTVCNRMKADMSQDAFRAHVRSISF